MDLKEQLRNQISFIQTSCDAFDRDRAAESIRIAVSLRVLFHDTKNQTSLLTQLGAIQLSILSTVADIEPGAVFFPGMQQLVLSGTGATVQPPLGNVSTKRLMDRQDWWDQIVVVSGTSRVSRWGIALEAADKDGGAHVDRKVGKNDKVLQDGVCAKVHYEGKKRVNAEPIPRTQLICLRQMGYEILNSPDLKALGQ